MLGKDFYVFWQFGLAVLHGEAFYSSPEALYPPAMLFLFAPLALLPFQISFALWSGLNVVLFYSAAKKLSEKTPWIWFLFSPTVFILMTGQIDIIFLWLATFLTDEKHPWKQIVSAVLITLKPQLAFVLLPWWLIRWLKNKPKQFLTWVIACIGFHSLPLILDGQIYHNWILSLTQFTESRIFLSPGLFSLTNFQIPVWLISLITIPVIMYGLLKSFDLSKAAQLLALPMGIWYDTILLVGGVSWKFLVPISWLAFILAAIVKSSTPFLIIPLCVFVLIVFKNQPPVNKQSSTTG